jgi:cobalt/nickel transport system permease protein
VSGGHGHGATAGDGLYLPGRSAVHRVPAAAALLATIGFVLVVVATPPTRPLAYLGYAALLAVAVVAARLRVRTVLARMVIEVPFVLFAVLVPFVATGPQVEVLGVGLARDGLVDAGGLLAKTTLGVAAAVVLSATQHPRDLLDGLQRLRVPSLVVAIAGFMLRYVHVVLDEMRRMRVARESRCHDARGLRHVRVLSRSVGALFVRSYERGERVHLAMLSRGWQGTMPPLDGLRPTSAATWAWAPAAVLPLGALAVLAATWGWS